MVFFLIPFAALLAQAALPIVGSLLALGLGGGILLYFIKTTILAPALFVGLLVFGAIICYMILKAQAASGKFDWKVTTFAVGLFLIIGSLGFVAPNYLANTLSIAPLQSVAPMSMSELPSQQQIGMNAPNILVETTKPFILPAGIVGIVGLLAYAVVPKRKKRRR